MDKLTILEEQGAKERERMKAEMNLPPVPFSEYVKRLDARREQIARERNQKIADAAWRLFINHLRVSQCDPHIGLYTGLQSPVVPPPPPIFFSLFPYLFPYSRSRLF